jgi:hypothetical protein
MAKGMEFMMKSLLDSLDPDTKAAIENIPKNVQTVAVALQTMDAKLTALLEAGTCARLEAIEIAAVEIAGKLDGHTIRLQAIQDAIAQMRPGYTPDEPLPTIVNPPTGPLAMVDVTARCIYSDAIGQCVLPVNHPGAHHCESNSMEAFGSGTD